MANILITDLLEESAYLLRSLLRGRGHAVSIAISVPEAEAKLGTGLFDTLVIDLCDPSKDALGVGRFANDMLPGMPIVALTRAEKEARIKGIDLYGKLYRPIQGARVNEVCGRAVAHALNLGVRRSCNRISIDIPASVQIGKTKFTARATDLSLRGVAFDATADDISDDQLDKLASLKADQTVNATLTPKKGESIKMGGRVAFIDRFRRHSGKVIGVIFEELESDSRSYVDELLGVGAAEEGAESGSKAA